MRRRSQEGYTLLEIVVAMTVLSIGSAVLWYTLRSSARLDKSNRLHHEANILARSELESLRGAPRRDIRDTSYKVEVSGEELLVVREVFDSSKVMSTMREVALDENLSPAELRKPLEVRVRVFRSTAAEDDLGLPDPVPDWAESFAGGEGEGRRTLAALILKIPEYRWH